MANVATISIGLVAKSAKFVKQLNKAGKRTKRFAKSAAADLARVGAALTALGGAAFVAVIRATAEQERVTAQLNAALKSTGEIAGFTADELLKQAATFQKVSTFSDEAVISMQSVLLTFTKIRDINFTRTEEAILNLATRMGTDLQAAAVQLGKALNDPIANLGELGRAGIQFSKDQKKLIKTLAETGRLAEAQGIVLDELDTQFGGAARAARDTLGGAFAALKNAAGDLLEQDGLPGIRGEIETLITFFQDPSTKAAVESFISGLVTGAGLVARAFKRVIETFNIINTFIRETIVGLDDPVRAAAKKVRELKEGVAALQSQLQGEFAQATPTVFAAMAMQAEVLRRQIQGAEENLIRLKEAAAEGLPGPIEAAGATTAPTPVMQDLAPFEQRQQEAAERFLAFQQQIRDQRIAFEQEVQDATLAGQEVTNQRLIELAQQAAEQKLAFEAEQRLLRGEAEKLSEEELNAVRLTAEAAILQQLADQRLSIKQNELDEIAKLEKQGAGERFKVLQSEQKKIANLRIAGTSLALNLLRTLGEKSKIAAIAAIAIEKAHAIANVIQQTAVGITFWTARGNLAMAGFMKILGAANVAMIAGTGLAQAGNVGGGGAAPGTPGGPPIITEPASFTTTGLDEVEPGFQGQPVIQINIDGNFVGDEENARRFAEQIRDMIDEDDVVIIGPNSRQAFELGGG